MPPRWEEDLGALPDVQSELDSVVDLSRLPPWMKSQGYVPIQPTLNSRSLSRPVSEGDEEESPRRRWSQTRPATEFALDEPQQAFPSTFDFIDAPTSDLPPQIDFASLPRWMRAVPEQGPPDEVECEAGSGPGWD